MKAQRTIAFECPQCHRQYGDPLYHGPAPHAPANLCLDCWVANWAEFEARIFKDREWTVLDEALWLICQGFTHSEAAGLVGRHPKTLGYWLQKMRKFSHLIPDWLSRGGSKNAPSRREGQ